MRVLVHDSDVVMYDAWWPHLDNWGLADVQEIRKQRISYYVTTAATLAEKATHVRLDPLTSDELAIHRPDLPFAFGQCAAISWPSEVPGTTARLAENWRTAGCPNAAMLQASEVYLAPFGPKGGVKAGVRVKAANGTAFTVEELIWKAAACSEAFPPTTYGASRASCTPTLPLRHVGMRWIRRAVEDTRCAATPAAPPGCCRSSISQAVET